MANVKTGGAYCFLCRKVFPNGSALTQHQRVKHPQLFGEQKSPRFTWKGSQKQYQQPAPQPQPYPPPGWGYQGSSSKYTVGGGFREETGKKLADKVENFFKGILHRLPLLILIGAFVFFFFFALDPSLRAATEQRASLAYEKANANLWISNFLSKLSPERILETAVGVGSFESRPDYLVPEVKGVQVQKMTSQEVYEGDPMSLEAEVLIDPLPNDDAKVTFGCYLSEDNTTLQTGIIRIAGQDDGVDTLPLPKGTTTQKAFVYCDLEGFYGVPGTFKDYKAYLTWEYKGVTTETVLRVYTQERAIKEQLLVKNRDPLQGLKGTDYVDADGFAIDNCVRDCGLADFGMEAKSPLPFVEGVNNYLTVKLFGLSTYKGNLITLHNIQLILPGELEIGTIGCIWLNKGGKKFDALGTHLLSLSEGDSAISKINDDLKNQKATSIEFRCGINVVKAGNQEIPAPATIRATAVYDYGGKEPALVRILRRPIEA